MHIKLKRKDSFIGVHSPMKVKLNDNVTDKIRMGQEKIIEVGEEQVYLQLVQGGRKSNKLKIEKNTEIIVENSVLNYFVYIPVVILFILSLYIDMNEIYRAIAFASVLAISLIYHFFVDSIKLKISNDKNN
ncbi:hypothetical protein [Salinicoccus roseus]|uniref:hypothetical protein n=1 Tax=Salinicoccus roseus TaxID=45670 RepID=UPI002301C58D|nr:hypothetical protein [Salinicoccus roseus]